MNQLTQDDLKKIRFRMARGVFVEEYVVTEYFDAKRNLWKRIDTGDILAMARNKATYMRLET